MARVKVTARKTFSPRKRTAQEELQLRANMSAKRRPTMSETSTSQQLVGSRMSDLEKSADSALSKNPSLVQLSSVAKVIIDPKKKDSQLKEQTTPDDLLTGKTARQGVAKGIRSPRDRSMSSERQSPSDRSTSSEPDSPRLTLSERLLTEFGIKDVEESLVNRPSSVAKAMIDPKKEDSQLNELITPDKLSAGSSAQLSYVASHVDVKFKDCSSIVAAHSRPDAKNEQGKFQFTLTNVSKLDQNVKCSPFHTIANLPWQLSLSFVNIEDKKFLALRVSCNRNCSSIFWSCETAIKLELLSNDSKHSFVRRIDHKFCCARKYSGIYDFIEWSQLMDPENEYLKNDEATIEVQVTIKKIIGFRPFSEFDFVPGTPLSNSDVVMIVGGQRLRVCKQYISIYSPVFHAMFFSECSERDKKEIILKDIVPDEFLELLHVIYPTHKPVTKDNVEFLLKLGDRFEVQFVMEECERLLIATNEVSTPKKLLYAEKYRFANLQDVCLKTIKGLADVQKMQKQEEYKEYSYETKTAILDQLLKC